MDKNNFLRFTATLFIICLIASGLLSSVYNFTKGKIKAQQEGEKASSLKDVLPGAKDFDFIDRGDRSYYIGKDTDGQIVGYAFVAEKTGYASDIVTMAGITKEGIIKGIKVLSQNETPGLGSKIVEVRTDKTIWNIFSKDDEQEEDRTPWFQSQFLGERVDKLTEEIEVITGATISSEAVISSVEEKAKVVLEEIRSGR